MIHSAFLLDVETESILAGENFWDIQFGPQQVEEFLHNWRMLQNTRGVPEHTPVHVGNHKIFHRQLLNNSLFIFCTDGNDEDRTVHSKMEEVCPKIESALEHSGSDYVRRKFRYLLGDNMFTNFKVCFVGSGGVGKTTLLQLLFGKKLSHPTALPQGDKEGNKEKPRGDSGSYRPTSQVQVDPNRLIEFGTFRIQIWDFPGQQIFEPAWKFYLQGTDLICLVTDSSFHNVFTKTKRLLRKIQTDASSVPIIIIANKQDLPESLDANRIQALLGVTTYPMEARNKEKRDDFLQILVDIICNSIGIELPEFKPKIVRPEPEEDAGDEIQQTDKEQGPCIPKHLLALGIDGQNRHLIFHIDYGESISDSIYLRELITALESSGQIRKLSYKQDVVIIERSENFILALQTSNDREESYYREILRRAIESMEIKLSSLEGYKPEWDFFETVAYHLLEDIPVALLSLDQILVQNKSGYILQFSGDVNLLSFNSFDLIDSPTTVRDVIHSINAPPRQVYACLQLLIAYGWLSYTDSQILEKNHQL